MKKIIKRNGFVYMAEIEPAYSTWVNLGKDPDDPRWKEEVKEMNIGDDEIEIKSKRKNTKKESE